MLLERDVPLGVGAFLVGIIDEQLAVHLDQNPVADDGDGLLRPLIVRNGALGDFLEIVQAAGFLGVVAGVAQLHLIPFRRTGLERRAQDDAAVALGIEPGLGLQDEITIAARAEQVTARAATAQLPAADHAPRAGIERHPAAQVLAVEQAKPTGGVRHPRHRLAGNSLRSPRAGGDCQQEKQDQTMSQERHFVAPNGQRL